MKTPFPFQRVFVALLDGFLPLACIAFLRQKKDRRHNQHEPDLSIATNSVRSHKSAHSVAETVSTLRKKTCASGADVVDGRQICRESHERADARQTAVHGEQPRNVKDLGARVPAAST